MWCAKNLMWNQFSLAICGLLLGMMLCTVSGCNDNDGGAPAAQRVSAQNLDGGQSQAGQQQPKPQQPQVQPPVDANPCGETEPVEEPEYAGPIVTVTEYSVKLPYEEFEGAKRFDIVCTVQVDQLVSSKAVWEILALDASGKVVGIQQQHLAIPSDYSKPLDINSFYCTAVPRDLEFRLTSKVAVPVDQNATGGNGRGADIGLGM